MVQPTKPLFLKRELSLIDIAQLLAILIGFGAVWLDNHDTKLKTGITVAEHSVQIQELHATAEKIIETQQTLANTQSKQQVSIESHQRWLEQISQKHN